MMSYRSSIRSMTVTITCLLALTITVAGCSTDAICERACDAWEGCWGYDECWDDCKADGDWDSGYADCCEDNAGDCYDLDIICG